MSGIIAVIIFYVEDVANYKVDYKKRIMFTIQGYLISIIYLVLCFEIINNIHCSNFLKRKILHLLMASWWLIRLFWKTTMIVACSGPFFFIFINWYFTKKRIVKDYADCQGSCQ